MRKSGKLLSMMVAGAMVLSMAGCSGSNNETTAAPEQTTAQAAAGDSAQTKEGAASEGKTYTVGICQLVQDDALDAATK